MRLLTKRALFDNERYYDAGVVDVPDTLTPPRDAEVWDGDKFVPVPLTPDKQVDISELENVRGEVPKEADDEDDLDSFRPTPKRRRK